MLNIAADVRLKDNRFVPAGDTAAVDDVLHQMTDLGHVSVERNEISIGQNKTRERIRMLFEDLSKRGEFHEAFIFLCRNIVKQPMQRTAYFVEGLFAGLDYNSVKKRLAF